MPADRTVAAFVGRRAGRSGLRFGLVFGAVVASSVEQYSSVYPTLESRRQLARTLGVNRGLQVLIGVPRAIDTVPGWTAWRSLGIVTIFGAIWGLLAGTRWLRGEEDAGRWELLVAGPTTRRRATAGAVVGLGAAIGGLWGVTAAITMTVGRLGDAHFPVGASLFLALTLVAPAALFLAVGALASQLASTRPQANALAAVAFGVVYLIRVVASSSHHLAWVQWLTPLGWIQQLHPLTGSRFLPLVPLILLIGGSAATTVMLAAARDVGSGLLAAQDKAPARTGLLGSPLGLAVRLARPAALGWTAAMAALGLVFGLVAQGIAQTPSTALDGAFARLGVHDGGVEAYLGIFFMIIGAAVAFASASFVNATREEEGDGRLETILAQPVTRASWLASRLTVAAGVVIAVGLAAGVAAWASAAGQHPRIGLGKMVGAGLNTGPPALLVLGFGTLAHGLIPRRAAAIAYAVVSWSFLVQLLGTIGTSNRLLLDTSIFHHLGLVPATGFRWTSGVVMISAALAATAGGVLALRRRDLAEA